MTPGAILVAGESCTAVVRFTPTAFFAGSEQTGSLTVTASDPVTGAVTSALIPVSGRGKLPTCLGMPATIVGTQFDERIEGTPGDDVIVGLGGRDIIDGFDGTDVVCGNEGSDVINGGPGNDTMVGGADQDFITGVDGDDLMRGEAGDDVLNFGDQEDGDDVATRPAAGRYHTWSAAAATSSLPPDRPGSRTPRARGSVREGRRHVGEAHWDQRGSTARGGRTGQRAQAGWHPMSSGPMVDLGVEP